MGSAQCAITAAMPLPPPADTPAPTPTATPAATVPSTGAYLYAGVHAAQQTAERAQEPLQCLCHLVHNARKQRVWPPTSCGFQHREAQWPELSPLPRAKAPLLHSSTPAVIGMHGKPVGCIIAHSHARAGQAHALQLSGVAPISATWLLVSAAYHMTPWVLVCSPWGTVGVRLLLPWHCNPLQARPHRRQPRHRQQRSLQRVRACMPHSRQGLTPLPCLCAARFVSLPHLNPCSYPVTACLSQGILACFLFLIAVSYSVL